MTHFCVTNLTTNGSDHGLLSWTKPLSNPMLKYCLGTNFGEIVIQIQTFSFKKMHLKVSSTKWGLFCVCYHFIHKIHYLLYTTHTVSFCFVCFCYTIFMYSRDSITLGHQVCFTDTELFACLPWSKLEGFGYNWLIRNLIQKRQESCDELCTLYMQRDFVPIQSIEFWCTMLM